MNRLEETRYNQDRFFEAIDKHVNRRSEIDYGYGGIRFCHYGGDGHWEVPIDVRFIIKLAEYTNSVPEGYKLAIVPENAVIEGGE